MSLFFDQWCKRASESGVPLLASLAATFQKIRSAIFNAWIYPISNGKIEGINNKIDAMQRMHYGLRDFRFLSLRILTLHRAQHTFADELKNVETLRRREENRLEMPKKRPFMS